MGECGELPGVELVAAGFLVSEPEPGAVLGAVGQPFDDGAPRQAALPLDVLLEGLKALLERLAARARPQLP
ncbi:hypothetical protein ACFVT6_18755 [Streptomyces sp. NPDC058049]|uniref:hypothetical protein n=1 Tax=Streptomyces sp. NPDC058049 TaxID=3346314 RepID=UPI0036E6D0C9